MLACACWHSAQTGLRSPILVPGDIMGSALDNERLAGISRLENLLGPFGCKPAADFGKYFNVTPKVPRDQQIGTAPEEINQRRKEVLRAHATRRFSRSS
jgi:hypothetical protein